MAKPRTKTIRIISEREGDAVRGAGKPSPKAAVRVKVPAPKVATKTWTSKAVMDAAILLGKRAHGFRLGRTSVAWYCFRALIRSIPGLNVDQIERAVTSAWVKSMVAESKRLRNRSRKVKKAARKSPRAPKRRVGLTVARALRGSARARLKPSPKPRAKAGRGQKA